MEQKVRFNVPYDFRCEQCNNIINYNKRFNAKKVKNNEYHILCPYCKKEIVFMKLGKKIIPCCNIVLVDIKDNQPKNSNQYNPPKAQNRYSSQLQESSSDYKNIDAQNININHNESSSEPFSPLNHRLIFQVKMGLSVNEKQDNKT